MYHLSVDTRYKHSINFLLSSTIYTPKHTCMSMLLIYVADLVKHIYQTSEFMLMCCRFMHQATAI